MSRVLVTGHLGLVGRHVQRELQQCGYEVVPFDSRDRSGDICDEVAVANAVNTCDGIVHLAAISRVIWAEQDPSLCWATNAVASTKLINAAARASRRPWVIAASSREVYGQATQLPVSENAPLAPVNIYGRSKVEVERVMSEAQATGLVGTTIRLSNVYGCPFDHRDRVIPAFCRAAILGTPLRVDGADTLFDFTHVLDVARGVTQLAEKLSLGLRLQSPVHFVSGRGTSLLDTAKLAVEVAASDSQITISRPRSYDVARFVGDPTRAQDLLGWRTTISLRDGIGDLVDRLRRAVTLAA